MTGNCKVVGTDMFNEKETFRGYLVCKYYFEHIFLVMHIKVLLYFSNENFFFLTPKTNTIKNIYKLDHLSTFMAVSQFLVCKNWHPAWNFLVGLCSFCQKWFPSESNRVSRICACFCLQHIE